MRTGDRIKELRKKSKFTQKQLAQKIHVSSQVISNWERGYSTPDSEDVKKLAETLDCSIDYLLGREGKKETINSDSTEFEAWANNPKLNSFYKEFNQSPEDRQAALLAVWEILKNQEKKEN